MNNPTWIVVADSTKACIYASHKALLIQDPKANHLVLIKPLTHEASRKKDSELATDKMGEFGHSTFEASSPHAHEVDLFAREILVQLETGRNENQFRDIILVAPPAFIGILQKHMHHELHKLVTQTIEKDYTHLPKDDLANHLITHF